MCVCLYVHMHLQKKGGQEWEVFVKAKSMSFCIHTHLHKHTLGRTPSYHRSPPYHVPLHICHSGKRKREGGIEQWKESREARSRQLIVWPVGEAERLRERLRKRGRERENNKVSLVDINLPHTAGMSVEASW